MKRGLIVIILILLSMAILTTSYAKSEDSNYDMFDQYFKKWTIAFNNKDVANSCGIFAKTMVADYRGSKRKNYTVICDGFKKIFQQPNRRYHYRFKLHNVYRSDDLAAVRISWYLTVYEKHKKISVTQDEGIDILKRNEKGEWLIVNYLAYGKNLF